MLAEADGTGVAFFEVGEGVTLLLVGVEDAFFLLGVGEDFFVAASVDCLMALGTSALIKSKKTLRDNCVIVQSVFGYLKVDTRSS